MKSKPITNKKPGRVAVTVPSEADLMRVLFGEEHHPDADTNKPLLLSEVAQHHDPKCRWPCSNGLVVVHRTPAARGEVSICGCAQKRFLAAHGHHVVKSKGQQFWRKSWLASRQPVPLAETVKEVVQ